MSALGRMPTIASIAGIGTSLAVVLSSPGLLSGLAEKLGLSSAQGSSWWRTLLAILLLLNLKNLPFAWHLRFLRIFAYHLYLRSPQHHVPASQLFSPVVISSRTPLMECDYNLHKSNSTYFSDLDMARSHLVTVLLRKGIRGTSKYHQGRKKDGHKDDGWDWANGSANGDANGVANGTANGLSTPASPESVPPPALPKGSFNIALGAVTCHFRREIPPYVKYEMWTRLISFDRKWLYLVTYFVKPGIIPHAYAIGPRPHTAAVAKWDALTDEQKRTKCRNAVYASSIAKYVVKKGRLTIPPEIVLARSDMLPPRPANIPPTFSPSGSGASTPAFAFGGMTPAVMTPAVDAVDEMFADGVVPGPASGDGEEWTWEAMERERQRGMKLVAAFAALDELHEDFDGGGEKGAIGRFDGFLDL